MREFQKTIDGMAVFDEAKNPEINFYITLNIQHFEIKFSMLHTFFTDISKLKIRKNHGWDPKYETPSIPAI